MKFDGKEGMKRENEEEELMMKPMNSHENLFM